MRPLVDLFLAQGVNGFNPGALADVVLKWIGSVIIVFAAWQLARYWLSDSFGKMIAVLAAACVLCAFTFFPDGMTQLLNSVVELVTGQKPR